MAMGRYAGGYANYDQRTAKLTPEEQKMREENLAAREAGYCDEGVRALYAAVALRTIKDYQRAIHNEKHYIPVIAELTKKECEEFFDSEAFSELTGGCGTTEVRHAIENGKADYLIYGRRMEMDGCI